MKQAILLLIASFTLFSCSRYDYYWHEEEDDVYFVSQTPEEVDIYGYEVPDDQDTYDDTRRTRRDRRYDQYPRTSRNQGYGTIPGNSRRTNRGTSSPGGVRKSPTPSPRTTPTPSRPSRPKPNPKPSSSPQ